MLTIAAFKVATRLFFAFLGMCSIHIWDTGREFSAMVVLAVTVVLAAMWETI